MSLERLIGESDLDYHRRLIYGKLVDKTLADIDYSELADVVYGQSCSSDFARRMMYGSCRTLQLLDREREGFFVDEDLLSELESKKIELQKERQKFFDQRNAFNKLVRERSRQEELNEIIVSAITNGNLPSLLREEYAAPPCSPWLDDCVSRDELFPHSENDILVSLNDIHYGIEIDNYWNTYNPTVFKDMLKHYITEIVRVGKMHGSESCIVWGNGDLISGNIHQSIAVANKENVIQQIIQVSELISEFLAILSEHFRTVKYVGVAGNHSRITPNKDMAVKDERLDDLVEWYLAARLQNFDNIEIGACNKIDSTMYSIDIRGKNYIGVHGDYDGSKDKLAALQSMAGGNVYAILLGHKHHNAVDNVQGVKTVMAGSFMGMDDFCIQKRIYGEAEQLLCICDNNGIRCYYDVKF